MRIDAIRTIEGFQVLAEEWNDLLSECASAVPFLRHEYLTAWWQTLGGGEWLQGELYILTGRDAAGRLLGIAPLFFSPNRQGVPALMLLGSIEISDYLDIIARPGDLPQFIQAVLEHLAAPGTPPWQVLDLYNLFEDSPSLALLQAAARRCGWIYEQQRLQHCPSIPLPGDWETYLAHIDKKQRHEVRRKMRRAAEADVPAHWYIVTDEATLDQEIDDFLYLMSQDDEKRTFLTDRMRLQMRQAVWAAFKAGWLQLAFLDVDGHKAAGYLNFDFGNKIWVYNSGLDYNFGAYSPGWVLLGHLLQWANEHKRVSFDFMRGDEDYKYRFGGVDRFIVRATIQR